MRRTEFMSRAALIGCAALLALAKPGEAAKPLERFTAFAVDMNSARAGARAGTIDIVINRWSTDDEGRQLASALREGGPESLLHSLQKIKDPVGYIQTPGSVGYPLRFARQTSTGDGGRRILLGTDRPISFLEAVNRDIVTSEYPFMVIDLRFDAKGVGQGRLLPLARVTSDEDHVVEIENYLSEPVRLTSVRKVE